MPLAPSIRDLDLEPISFCAAVEYGWSLDKVDSVELEYRAFLQAIHDHPGRAISPGRDCDLYWHMHLLDTQRYLEDCTRIFGRFIHHFPYSGIRSAQDLKLQRRRYAQSQVIIGRVLAGLRNSTSTQSTEKPHETATPQRRPSHTRRPRRLSRRAGS